MDSRLIKLALARLAVNCKFGKTHYQPARAAAESDLVSYLDLLEQGFECTREDFVLVGIYLLRMNDTMSLKHFSLHRCVLASLVIAIKFLHDDVKHNSTEVHAYAAGVSSEELQTLEIEILKLLGWRIFVDEPEFSYVLTYLLRQGELLCPYGPPPPTQPGLTLGPCHFSVFSIPDRTSHPPDCKVTPHPAHVPVPSQWASQPPCAAGHPVSVAAWPQPPCASSAHPLARPTLPVYTPQFGCATDWKTGPSSSWAACPHPYPSHHA